MKKGMCSWRSQLYLLLFVCWCDPGLWGWSAGGSSQGDLGLAEWGEIGVGWRKEHVEEGVALEEESAEPTIWGGFHCYLLWPTSRSRWEGWDVLVVIWANSVCYLVRYCKGWYQLVLCLNILPLVSGKYMVEPFSLSQKFRSWTETWIPFHTQDCLEQPGADSCLLLTQVVCNGRTFIWHDSLSKQSHRCCVYSGACLWISKPNYIS